jgi:hypothetical protein
MNSQCLYFVEIDGYRFMTGYSTIGDARFMARPAAMSGKQVSIIRFNFGRGKTEARLAA